MGEAVFSDGDTVDLSNGQRALIIDVGGDVDLASAPRLHQRLLSCFQQLPERVTVDMTNVSFVDSSALGVLVNARNRAAAVGCQFEVILPAGSARFPFDVTGLSAKFEAKSEAVV